MTQTWHFRKVSTLGLWPLGLCEEMPRSLCKEGPRRKCWSCSSGGGTASRSNLGLLLVPLPGEVQEVQELGQRGRSS